MGGEFPDPKPSGGPGPRGDAFKADVIPDTYEGDKDKAWHMAHDEKYTREDLLEFLKDPTKAEVVVGSSLSEAIESLYKAYLEGKHITTDHNGIPLSSREIGELGLDGAYLKFLDYDRESYIERSKLIRRVREAQANLAMFEAVHGPMTPKS